MQFNLDSELAFADTLYDKACKGLEEDEYPPKPYEFYEMRHELVPRWEETKAQLFQAEGEEMEAVKKFFSCTTAKYIELLSAICKKADELESKEKEESYDSTEDDLLEQSGVLEYEDVESSEEAEDETLSSE